MSLLMNQNLLKHREVSTASLNNLCTIVHKMAVEGTYTGQVYTGQANLLGSFSLVYDKNNQATQAQIDLSAFDDLTQVNLDKKPFATPPEFITGQDGIVIFFITGTHADLYATLTDSNNQVAFDSRALDKGDAAVFRLIATGTYELADSAGQTLDITVNEPVDGKYADINDQQPVIITLDGTGFTPAVAAIDPLQVIIISIEVPATLDLTKS